MHVRIFETDFNGKPVPCTGEHFHGGTALEVVRAMSMNPFTGNLPPGVFMRQVLERIGEGKFPLSEDEAVAAEKFLHRLIVCGYGEFELAENEINRDPVNNEKGEEK